MAAILYSLLYMRINFTRDIYIMLYCLVVQKIDGITINQSLFGNVTV